MRQIIAVAATFGTCLDMFVDGTVRLHKVSHGVVYTIK